MDRFSHEELPLLASLYAVRDRTGFHMPGHRGGRAFPTWLKTDLLALDNTEIDLLDDLNSPHAAALKSMEQAAFYFDAAYTRYVTTGSTTSLKIAIASVVPHGGTILLARSVHKAIANMVAEQALVPLFFDSIFADDCPYPVPVVTTWPAQTKPAAIVITSPDYYGRFVDVATLATFAHTKGIPLIVDAAHGPHLIVDPQQATRRALALGADIVVESAHKTLPSLTPASLLHVNKDAVTSGRVCIDRIMTMLRVYQTSSPSFLIAASLEYGIAALRQDGERRHAQVLQQIASFRSSLPTPYRLWPDDGRDPLRLVIDVSATNRSARSVASALVRRGIDVELYDARHLVLIVSLWQEAEDFSHLRDALQAIAASPSQEPFTSQNATMMLPALLHKPPQFVMSAHEAMFGSWPRKSVSLVNSMGEIAAEMLTPTPPCIPLVWAGERLDTKRVMVLQALLGEATRILVVDSNAT